MQLLFIDIKPLFRQAQWLKAAGRDDLLEKEPTKLTVSYRFCSRHFAPSSTRNRYLGADAIPTFYVPGSRLSGTGEGNLSLRDMSYKSVCILKI